jgi:hypothetical protein
MLAGSQWSLVVMDGLNDSRAISDGGVIAGPSAARSWKVHLCLYVVHAATDQPMGNYQDRDEKSTRARIPKFGTRCAPLG